MNDSSITYHFKPEVVDAQEFQDNREKVQQSEICSYATFKRLGYVARDARSLHRFMV